MLVHILYHGQALCPEAGRTLPSDWPEDWKWVSLVEAYNITEPQRCSACYKAAADSPELSLIATPEKHNAQS